MLVQISPTLTKFSGISANLVDQNILNSENCCYRERDANNQDENPIALTSGGSRAYSEICRENPTKFHQD